VKADRTPNQIVWKAAVGEETQGKNLHANSGIGNLQEVLVKVSAFVGTSLDGFLARRNGEYDFLPVDGGEPHGYEEFLASVDTVVIGRNTFDVVLKLPDWPYGDRRVVVLSHRPIHSEKAVVMSGDPRQVIDELARKKAKHVYVDGGITVQEFLRAGQIDEVTITRVPVLIGEGIPLFGAVPHDIRLRHLGTRQFESGLVTSRYEVMR
jgi:dihydrofolate reductase